MGIQTEKVPRKVHVNTASKEDKERFKKEQDTGYSQSPTPTTTTTTRKIHSSIYG